MEVSVIGSSQAKLGASDFVNREVALCNLKNNLRFLNDRVSFGRNIRWKKAEISFTLKAIQTEPVREEKKCSGSGTRSKTKGRRILTEEEEKEVWAILEDDNYKGMWILTEEVKEMMKMEQEREMVEMMQNLDIIKETEMCRQIFDKYYGKDVPNHSHSLLQQQLLEQQEQRARTILDLSDVSPHLVMRHQLEEIQQEDARNAEEEEIDDARNVEEEEGYDA